MGGRNPSDTIVLLFSFMFRDDIDFYVSIGISTRVSSNVSTTRRHERKCSHGVGKSMD